MIIIKTEQAIDAIKKMCFSGARCKIIWILGNVFEEKWCIRHPIAILANNAIPGKMENSVKVNFDLIEIE